MRKSVAVATCVLSVFFLSARSSEATLIDRGSGLIYDDVLNITWLQDAQYSLTTGYAPDGRMNWGDANAWAAGLQYRDTTRGVTLTGWRLPTTVNSPSSLGYETTGLSSELAYMYYVNLGYAPNYTHNRFDPAPTSTNYNPFLNLDYRGYWSQTATEFDDQAWAFHFHFGSQERGGVGDGSRVWAVRDGDVGAAVPEPASLAFVALGFAGLGLSRRKARSTIKG